MTNYSLATIYEEKKSKEKESWIKTLIKMLPLLRGENKQIIKTICAVILNAGFTLLGPLVIGFVIDTYIKGGDYHGVLVYSGILLVIYAGAFVSNYVQIRVMGAVAQRTLWKLRNEVFDKIMELPLAFFNQNKSGDLISRINNDIDKLSQFLSQGLMQFAGTFFMVLGSSIFILVINWKLGTAALIPAAGIFIFTQLISSWNKKRNVKSLRATGALSGEIQESITNFKVILAFNRRDYFNERFSEVNSHNFKAAVGAGVSNELLTPVFEWGSNLALLMVLGYGVYLITQGEFAVGLLVSYVLYVTRLYDPLRTMARLWTTFQSALAGWDRIGDILALSSDLKIIPSTSASSHEKDSVIEFKNVSFAYPDSGTVLKNANLVFEKGKTYALVGPTGGGKTTTASLIARLFDPTSGTVLLHGKDIRSYEPEERSQKIGFILQEPFLFSGTVRENILYGNRTDYAAPDALETELKNSGLSELLTKFDKGLDTKVEGQSLSLGQRQLIAFIRAVLRKPEILILDEATANIDTITEQLLGSILEKLPRGTTRVVIAHRLNTIENADGIFFVNNGEVVEAGSMEHAVDMLLHNKRTS